MATISVSPIVLKDCTLTIASDDYEAHVSQVQFDPSNSSVTWQGLTPTATHTDTSSSTWTCTLALAQDWETTNSLSRYLFENEGQTKSMTFEPKAGGASFTANVIIVPGSIGGTVNQFATATVTLPVSGRPALAS